MLWWSCISFLFKDNIYSILIVIYLNFYLLISGWYFIYSFVHHMYRGCWYTFYCIYWSRVSFSVSRHFLFHDFLKTNSINCFYYWFFRNYFMKLQDSGKYYNINISPLIQNVISISCILYISGEKKMLEKKCSESKRKKRSSSAKKSNSQCRFFSTRKNVENFFVREIFFFWWWIFFSFFFRSFFFSRAFSFFIPIYVLQILCI